MTFGRFLTYCALSAAAAYCGLTFYPGAFFGNAYGYKNISVYTRVPIIGSAETLLGRVHDAIAADDFFDPGQKFEIYLTGGYAEYTFWAPFCRKSGSCMHPVSNKIFIASSDFDKNLAYGRGAGEKPRLLENVMIRELVLAQLKNKLGVVNYTALQDWLKEGYAEHIARETVDMDPAGICGGREQNAPLARYLESRLIMETAKNEALDAAYPEFLKANHNSENLRRRVMGKYCGK